MAYYYFNKCDSKSVVEIEELANNLGLEEVDSFPPIRVWKGNIFQRKKEFDRHALLTYLPESKFPLAFQTAPEVTHEQEDVKNLVQKIIQITNSTGIKGFISNYNLIEFK